MSNDSAHKQAQTLWQRAYEHQMNGEFGEAMRLYKKSITTYPTAEAYTFLAWTHSTLGRYELAIELCEKAVEIDPDFGNPYNDIGAYLIELGRHKEAVAWLKKALAAPRYDAPHYPLLNLGRVYQEEGDYRQALAYYDKALAQEPFYQPAHWAKQLLWGRLN
ncbi:MAG: tetratricopeptide repeat protein [Chloroflexota bacterium]|jgi:Tfp pilus assembly protein PilF